MSWGEGSMTWSELRDLVTALPEDSATKAAAAGDKEGRRWSQSTYLDAAMVNLLQLVAVTLWKAHLKGEPPQMTPVEPPQLEADEQANALAEARDARNRAVLDRLSPKAGTDDAAQRQAEIDEWMRKIRELEAAQPQNQQQ